MEEEEITQDAPIVEDDSTQGEESEAALQDNAEHADEDTVIEEEQTSPSEEKHDVAKEEFTPDELRRMRLKMQAQDREIAEMKKKQEAPIQQGGTKELTQEQAAVLNDAFRGNPEAYEAWRKNWTATGGRDQGPYHQIYGGQPAQQVNNNQQSNGVDIYQALDDYSVTKKFLEENPKYDATNAKDTLEAQEKATDLYIIKDIASRLQARANIRGEKLTQTQAMKQAEMVLDPKNTIERAKENGKLLANQERMLKGSGATSGLSSGAAKATDSIALSDSEREIAKKLGVSEDAYKAQKRKTRAY